MTYPAAIINTMTGITDRTAYQQIILPIIGNME